LGLYLFTKHFLIGEERLELFNKTPEIIDISYKEVEGRKIQFGDFELILPFKDFTSIEISPDAYIYENQDEDYFVTLTLYYKYGDDRKTFMIHLWKPDQKWAERYIKSSNYTFDKFNSLNTLQNINSLDLLVSKWMFLPSDNDIRKQPKIVNNQSLKGFWSTSFDNKWNFSSFDFSTKGKSYTIMLVDSDEVVSTEMNNIISSIKPIEDSQNVIEILSSNYKKGVSIFEKQLALISLISIEGPTIDNLSELKKLLIQKGARTENIEDIEKQIDILSINANAVSNY
jgi:hypothetical protein